MINHSLSYFFGGKGQRKSLHTDGDTTDGMEEDGKRRKKHLNIIG